MKNTAILERNRRNANAAQKRAREMPAWTPPAVPRCPTRGCRNLGRLCGDGKCWTCHAKETTR